MTVISIISYISYKFFTTKMLFTHHSITYKVKSTDMRACLLGLNPDYSHFYYPEPLDCTLPNKPISRARHHMPRFQQVLYDIYRNAYITNYVERFLRSPQIRQFARVQHWVLFDAAMIYYRKRMASTIRKGHLRNNYTGNQKQGVFFHWDYSGHNYCL